jgi:tetratricopeptide (TPR) repeat protein
MTGWFGAGHALRLAGMLVIGLALAACESTEDRILRHMARGAELVQQGQDDKARLEFANALKLDPALAAAHSELARLYERAGRPDLMYGHLQKLTEQEPANAWALTRMAQAALGGNDRELALRHAEAAVAAAPGSAEALATRAAVFLALGRVAPALADAKAAQAIEPQNPVAAGVMAREMAARKDFAAARAVIEAALAVHQRDEDLNRLRLAVLAGAGEMAELGLQLGRMVELLPGDPGIWDMLLQWHVANGDPAGGLERMRARLALPFADRLAEKRFADLARLPAGALALRGPEGVAEARRALEALAGAAAAAGRDPALYRVILAEFDYANGARDAARAALRALAAVPAEAGETALQAADRARVMLARILAGEGDRAGADALVGEVLARDPKNAEALALRAAGRIDRGDIEAALTDLRAGLAESPGDPQLLILSGEAELRRGNMALAGENFASAMEASDHAPVETLRYVSFLIAQEQENAAETVLSGAVLRRPGLREFLIPLAQLRIRLGRWAEADAITAELDALDAAGAAEADRLRAGALFRQERFDESIAILRKLMEDPAARETSMGALVAALVKAGQPGEAAAFLAEQRAADPDNLQAIYLEGALAETQGDPAGALERYRLLVERRPDLVRTHEVMAEFHQRAGDLDAAVAAVEAGIAALPAELSLPMRLGGLRELQGRFDDAIATYEALLARSPDSLVLVNNIVSLVSEHSPGDAGRMERAAALAERLRGTPYPEFQDTYGWFLHVSGRNDEAVEPLAAAAEKLGTNPWVRYHFGIVLAAIGRKDEARGHLQAALELAGTAAFPPAARVRETLATLTQ